MSSKRLWSRPLGYPTTEQVLKSHPFNVSRETSLNNEQQDVPNTLPGDPHEDHSAVMLSDDDRLDAGRAQPSEEAVNTENSHEQDDAIQKASLEVSDQIERSDDDADDSEPVINVEVDTAATLSADRSTVLSDGSEPPDNRSENATDDSSSEDISRDSEGDAISVITPDQADSSGTPLGQSPEQTNDGHIGGKRVSDQDSTTAGHVESDGSDDSNYSPRRRITSQPKTQPKKSAPVSLDVSRETRVPTKRLKSLSEPRKVVVANQKGGVGKTTTAVNLAVALAQGGLRVLVVDVDPQGNASTALSIPHDEGTPSVYEVLLDGLPIADAVVESPEAKGLFVVPATIDLAGAELELVSKVAREQKLTKAINAYLAENHVDFIFFDCPPSLGLLTVNALVAATDILIPIQCEYYALEGVTQLMRTIQLVTGELNQGLRLWAVLLTMFDGRTKLAAQVAEEVQRHFEHETLRTVIPRSVRVSEAPSYGQSVLTYDANSVGANAYRKVAQELAQRVIKEQ